MARPTVMTPGIMDKLEEVYALGGTDGEACLFAGIGKSTLYKYQETHPEFIERKEELQESPVLKARRTIDKSLDSPQSAQWFLERKRKKEFSVRTEISGDIDIKVSKLEEIQNATSEILEREADGQD